jgi:hypothetical protein
MPSLTTSELCQIARDAKRNGRHDNALQTYYAIASLANSYDQIFDAILDAWGPLALRQLKRQIIHD